MVLHELPSMLRCAVAGVASPGCVTRAQSGTAPCNYTNTVMYTVYSQVVEWNCVLCLDDVRGRISQAEILTDEPLRCANGPSMHHDSSHKVV